MFVRMRKSETGIKICRNLKGILAGGSISVLGAIYWYKESRALTWRQELSWICMYIYAQECLNNEISFPFVIFYYYYYSPSSTVPVQLENNVTFISIYSIYRHNLLDRIAYLPPPQALLLCLYLLRLQPMAWIHAQNSSFVPMTGLLRYTFLI